MRLTQRTIAGAAMPLDVPTLFMISTCVTAILGLFLLFAWIQDRSIRALAWWSAGYLVGALAAALWSMHDAISRAVTLDVVYALLFLACGIIWNGARMFHARPVLPGYMFGGAILWLIVCQSPIVNESDHSRIMLGSLFIGTYTLLTAFELWRERGEQLFSRWPAVGVLTVHGVLFLLPIPLVLLLPVSSSIALASGWYPILSLETLLFAIGTAFIILVMAKERSDQIHRVAASTDALTGVSNRRGFIDEAERLIRKAAWKKQPVTVLMFDLDHFKSINDRFGHGTGDEVLRVFAMTATLTLRATDLFGRFGGEEFAAILAGDINVASPPPNACERRSRRPAARSPGRRSASPSASAPPRLTNCRATFPHCSRGRTPLSTVPKRRAVTAWRRTPSRARRSRPCLNWQAPRRGGASTVRALKTGRSHASRSRSRR